MSERDRVRASEYSFVEKPFMDQLSALGWKTLALTDSQKHDPESSYRTSLSEVIIVSEFRSALLRLNPWLTDAQADDLVMEMQQYSSRNLLDANVEVFDRMTLGFSAFNEETGEVNCPVRVIDFSDVDHFDPNN